MRDEIAARFLDFAFVRAAGDDAGAAAAGGRFSALVESSGPDLFGSLDILYAAHILGSLDQLTDDRGRLAWIDFLLGHQEDDGWFRAQDAQSHGVEHATAYALGGLLILSDGDGARLRGKLKLFTALRAEIAAAPSETRPPFSLTMLQRVHFWRGSHRAGGLAAIVGMVADLGLSTREYLGIEDAEAWLAGWWAYFAERIDKPTGYWALGPTVLRIPFDMLYRRRHDPRLAAMGGAVHLYWVSEKIAAPMPYPEALIPTTIALMEPTGLYEKAPYCIDLDANFLIGRALPRLAPGSGLEGEARQALATNREAVLTWLASRPHGEWGRSSHALPGALAAVAEADRILLDGGGDRPWRDIFETTWWL